MARALWKVHAWTPIVRIQRNLLIRGKIANVDKLTNPRVDKTRNPHVERRICPRVDNHPNPHVRKAIRSPGPRADNRRNPRVEREQGSNPHSR
jgi:hypothetical protein